MTALGVRYPAPRPTRPKDRPRPAPTRWQRFASDRELVGLKISLLVGLGLLTAALERLG